MDIKISCICNQKGITLVAVILIILAVAMIAFGAISLTVNLEKIANKRSESKRIYKVRDALISYYQNYQDLPIDDSATSNPVRFTRIPVDKLGLDQKYRLDYWGQHIDLYTVQQDDPLVSGVIRTDINAFVINDNIHQAALLISGGPNMVIDTPIPSSTSSPDIDGASDDILVSVNLNEVAQKIVVDELEIIRQKLWAYWCAGDGISPGPRPKMDLPTDSTSVYLPHTDYSDDNSSRIVAFLNDYGLSDSYSIDPWLSSSGEAKFYHLHPSYVLSEGPEGNDTSDDIRLPTIKAKCNGLTIPLAKYDFDNLDEFTVEDDDGDADVTLETEGAESAVSFNQDVAGDGDGSIYVSANEDYFDFSLSDSFTILCWILTDQSGPMTLVSKMRSDGRGYAVKVDNGKVCLELSDNSSILKTCGELDVDDGYCHYVAVSYDADNGSIDKRITVYDFKDNGNVTVNKTPDTNQWPLETVLNDEPFRLSGYGTPPTELYTGIMDELVIYDQVIEQGEIQVVKGSFFGKREPPDDWDFCCTGTAGPMLGDGSAGNPWQIVGWNNLQDVGRGTNHIDPVADPSSNNYARNHNYKLMNNIRFCDGTVFVPINLTTNNSNSNGFVLDGNYKVIKDLVITQTNNNVGLIRYLGRYAQIKNLGIEDASVTTTRDMVGILVGRTQGTISQCYTTGEVSGRNRVGGLTGRSQYGRIEYCYSTASASGSASSNVRTGGLIGVTNANGLNNQIYHCYAAGNVYGLSGNGNTGGLIGRLNSSPLVTDCFWNTDIFLTSATRSGGPYGTGYTDAQMRDNTNFSTWDKTNIWLHVDGFFPVLKQFP